MLTYGGREATDAERSAVQDFISCFSQQAQTLRFPEIAVLETDGYGRVMVFLRVLHADGLEEPLLVIFKQLGESGSYLAGPKSILRVRAASYYAGIEHHKTRNSWECPPDAEPDFES
jgi:hypothetical protein